MAMQKRGPKSTEKAKGRGGGGGGEKTEQEITCNQPQKIFENSYSPTDGENIVPDWLIKCQKNLPAGQNLMLPL